MRIWICAALGAALFGCATADVPAYRSAASDILGAETLNEEVCAAHGAAAYALSEGPSVFWPAWLNGRAGAVEQAREDHEKSAVGGCTHSLGAAADKQLDVLGAYKFGAVMNCKMLGCEPPLSVGEGEN